MSDVVYISVNNWFCGRDYPDTPNFRKWLGNDLKQSFSNNDWVKENKLCVNAGNIDMSSNYTITAPKEWVEQNCSELLTDDEYSYDIISGLDGRVTYKKKFSDFVFHPNENGDECIGSCEEGRYKYGEECVNPCPAGTYKNSENPGL